MDAGLGVCPRARGPGRREAEVLPGPVLAQAHQSHPDIWERVVNFVQPFRVLEPDWRRHGHDHK